MTTIYKSKNPEVNREFSEGQETEDKILAALKKIPEMNNYESIEIDEIRDDLRIIAKAYKNVINVNSEMKSRHPVLKNISMINAKGYGFIENVSWNYAINYAKKSGFDDFSDWRLPTIEEAEEIAKIYKGELSPKTILWTSKSASATEAYVVIVDGNVITIDTWNKDAGRGVDCFTVR